MEATMKTEQEARIEFLESPAGREYVKSIRPRGATWSYEDFLANERAEVEVNS
jgi:hypothetical protein